MTDAVLIHDVSLRDGLQNLSSIVPLAGKLELLDALLGTGLNSFEVTSFVSPKAIPQLADAAELFGKLPDTPGVAYEVLVPNMKGYERATAAGARRISIVVAATESLNRANFNMSVAEGMRVSLDVIARAKAHGVQSRAYVAGAMRCGFEGDVDPAVVLDLIEKLLEGGADQVTIADTIGGGGPLIARRLFDGAVARFGAERLSAHLHDTRGLATALALIALEAGIRRFDASIGGLGGCPFAPGAAGNIATEDLLLLLNEAGMQTNVDLDAIMEAVEIAAQVVNRPVGGRMHRWWNATSPEMRYFAHPHSRPS